MTAQFAEIRDRGKTLQVPSVQVGNKTIVVTGRWLKTAGIRDEGVMEGSGSDPQPYISCLRERGLKADVFSFIQKIPDVAPAHSYAFEWDNLAVASITSFDDWWNNLPQESRKNARRASKRGVVVKTVSFDDDLVKGIHNIYSKSPVRQGRKFWHYGKDFETVKREHATYLERSEFIGAYFEGELIGFIKMVYVDQVAVLFQIIADGDHHDKRPMNALVAKAVEVCATKGLRYLTYGKYTYGNKVNSSLAEFKRRNGFEQVNYPRYFIPLTLKGRIALRAGLHRGIVGVLPPHLITFLVGLRARLYRTVTNVFRSNAEAAVNPKLEKEGV